MKLKGTVKQESDGSYVFTGKLYDGTLFNLTAGNYDLQLNEGFTIKKPIVEGWLYVVKESQQADRCYITLPKPTIQYGRNITVSEFDLMRPGATLDDFKADPSKPTPVSPDISIQELESKVMNTAKRSSGVKKKKAPRAVKKD